MSNSLQWFQKVLALIFWLIALFSLGWYARISIRLWLNAVRRREPSLPKKNHLPLVAGVIVTVGATLLSVGVVLWFPELGSLLPYGLVVALILGASAAINIRIRHHYGKRLAKREESEQSR